MQYDIKGVLGGANNPKTTGQHKFTWNGEEWSLHFVRHRISLLFTADTKSRTIIWPLFTVFKTRAWKMLRWDWTLKFISYKEHLNKWNKNSQTHNVKKRLLALSRQHHAMLQSGVLRVFYQFEPSWTQAMSFSVFEGSILGLSQIDQQEGWRRVDFRFWKSESWP